MELRWWLVLALAGCAADDATADATTLDASGPATTDATAGASTAGPDDGGTTAASDGESTDGGDTSTGDAAETTGGVACQPPDAAPAWGAAYQTDLVARLAGADEVTPGLVLSDRATPARRAATRDFLVDRLTALGLRPQLHQYDLDGANVWVPIPATDPSDETVVFGAHFDTVPGSPGANDNATGVAVAMALARWLADAPCRTRNVIVVFLDQEEIGLVGAGAFASFLVGQGLDVVSVHTIDQMGWDADGDRAVELERPDAGLARLYEGVSSTLPSPVPLTPTRTGATDHVAFRDLGFDAVGLTEEFASGDTTPHYHQPGDTFDTVDFGYLESTTTLVLATFGRLVTEP